MADYTQDCSETLNVLATPKKSSIKLVTATLRLTATPKKADTKVIKNTIIVSDTPRNMHGITLSEIIKVNDYNRNLQNTYLSVRAKWVEFRGTYKEVVDYLDAQRIPENKVKGFVFLSAGKAMVLVHKH